MKTMTDKLTGASAAWIFANPFGPQIALEPEGAGNGGGEAKTGEEGKPAEEGKAAEEGEKGSKENTGTETNDDAGKKSGEGNENTGAEKKDDDESRNLLREVMDKKAKIKELTEQIEQFKGIDPEKAREALKKLQDAEVAEAEAKGEFDRVKKMMADQHEAEKAELQAQIDKLQEGNTSLATQIDELTIGRHFGDSRFIADNLVLTPSKTRELYGSHFELRDGQLVGFDKPKGKGERTMLVDGSGAALSFEAAMKKIIDTDPDKDSLLKVKMNPGADSKTAKVETGADKSGSKKLFGASRISAGLGLS